MRQVRRQFGSIEAVYLPADRVGLVRADATIVHAVGTADDASSLVTFWQRQHAAPCSEAMISALGWLRLRMMSEPLEPLETLRGGALKGRRS